ncbi:cupin domain-containing protein [Pseudotenacibaculum sp. MALMAid0570]|uniref:cupin domain-containing protein n=1 Tax=Pseudotenacibaculum sp. MALMAid0570 TaxID=3143938 RepID=UPI0032DE4F05
MFTKELHQITQKEIIQGFKARFVHTKNTTIAYWEVEKGAELPSHSHVHEQIAIVTKGLFEMTIGGKTETYEPGKIAVIPSNVEHSGKALTYCEITDVFSPTREDYK